MTLLHIYDHFFTYFYLLMFGEMHFSNLDQNSFGFHEFSRNFWLNPAY